MALGVAVPSNVEFIAKWGEGLYWFKSTGYRQLLSSVSKQPKNSKKAVIINPVSYTHLDVYKRQVQVTVF